MKKYEKILLALLCVLILATLLLPSSIYLFVPTFFTIWLLGLSYFLGGHSLFYIAKEKEAYLPLFAGLSYGPAVITLSLSITLQQPDYFVYFPIPTLLLTVGLAIYILLKRKKGGIDKEIRMIFYRGLVLSLISSFFLYIPTSFTPYRKVLLALNSGDSNIAINIAMMDAAMESEAAFNKGDCEAAISYALASYQQGKRLIETTETEEEIKQNRTSIFNTLKQEDIIEFSDEARQMLSEYQGEDHLYPINLTYINLYKAYICKGQGYYDQQQYQEALANFLTAYQYLTTPTIKSFYYQKEQAFAFNMIGNCYKNLNKIDLASAFYTLAITHYQTITNKNEVDVNSATFLHNLAVLLSNNYEFNASNQLLQLITTSFPKEEQTPDPEKQEALLKSYQLQTVNYLAQDSLQQALTAIGHAQKLVKKESVASCDIQLTVALCQLRFNEYSQALTTLESSLSCLESHPPVHSMKIVENAVLMAQTYFALGQFEKAQHKLSTALDLIAKGRSNQADVYAYSLKLTADLNKITGKYATAAQQYQEALDIYNQAQLRFSHNIPLTLLSFSDLEVIQSNLSMAQAYVDQAHSYAITPENANSLSATQIYNQSAYVAYHRNHLTTADTLYQKTMRITANYNLPKSTVHAEALNGLGLIELNRKNYSQADKYFQESLILHQQIYSDKSPFTAQIYLNYGILNTREGKLAEAKGKLDQSLKINQQFFKTDHPVFGDLYAAFGDLAIKKGERDLAQQQYQKALAIYHKYFDSTHWKVRETQQKLK